MTALPIASPVLELEPLTPEDFDALDGILDDLRTRNDETPQWEFCEGFMAALICCRRVIATSEYLPLLLDIDPPGDADHLVGAGEGELEGSFADAAQAENFMRLWFLRCNEVARSLDAEVQSLDDERAYHPELVDVRGTVAALPPQERGEIPDTELPYFGQVWAIGFMFAVETWAEDWAPPRDKALQKQLDASLQAIIALAEDDTEPATLSLLEGDGPPSISAQRMRQFSEALWATYTLRDLWRGLGPRVQSAHKTATPGRNDPCFCGSGKKYKKCHGA